MPPPESVFGQFGSHFTGRLFDVVVAENVPAIAARNSDQIFIRFRFRVGSINR